MGHLGNPIGFRLGFQKNWKHNWFIKNLYYPEFINDMLNIRDYLYYYMTRSVMLKSGFCLSHFFLYKWWKNYYIKVYIYQIDLEKLSYEYINKAFFNYYEVYNDAIKRPINIRNKAIVRYFRDLSNSDLFVSYFTFFNFIYKSNTLNKLKCKAYFNNNIYIKEALMQNFTDMLLLDYINIILEKFISRFLLTDTGHLKGINKILFRAKRIKKKNLKILIAQASKILNEKKKKNWTIEETNLLEYCLKKIYKKKKKKIFFSFLFRIKKNIKKWLHRLYVKKLRDTSSDPFFIYKIKNLQKRTIFELQNSIFKKNNNIKFVDFFFYLAKKVGFQKFRNSKNLKYKWASILGYLKVFNKLQFIKKKFNIKSFFYFISIYIYTCKISKKNKTYFNLKNSIYYSMYVGIAKKFFVSILKLVTTYMKYLVVILCNKIQYKYIFFIYYFITNKNVTSHLISRYIALRLKKNFTLLKTLNPLKRELVRLSKKTRTSRNAFVYYNYKMLFNSNKKKLKTKIKKILHYYHNFFYSKNYYYYINNLNFLYYSTFLYHKNSSYIQKKKAQIKIKYLMFLKIFYINIYYKIILNLYKGKKIKLNKKNVLINLLNIFNILLPLKYKKILSSKAKLVYISSFFYKNVLNFEFAKLIWARFKQFNARNLRNEYIPKFKSILMGYKMAFRGRFSRKQRASFVWTQIGKAPLNTININIDYSFFTIPLKNSIVSIKIWLYKTKSYVRFKYFLKF